MARKKVNEATIAPPPVSDASVLAVKKVVKNSRKSEVAAPVAVKPEKTVAPAVQAVVAKAAPVVKAVQKVAPAVKAVVKAAPAAKAVAKPKAAPKPAPKAKVEAVESSIANLAEAVETPRVLNAREIEERAYQSWIDRGCPMGSPEEDWFRAEQELISRFAASSK